MRKNNNGHYFFDSNLTMLPFNGWRRLGISLAISIIALSFIFFGFFSIVFLVIGIIILVVKNRWDIKKKKILNVNIFKENQDKLNMLKTKIYMI